MTKEEKIALFKEARTTDCGECVECMFRGDDAYCVEYFQMNFVCEKARKEVAREIFEEIENNSFEYGVNFLIGKDVIAELKKKYTESEDE